MAIANGYTLRWPSPMAISTCAIADENRRLFAPMPMLRWHRENHRDHDGDGHRTIGFAIGPSEHRFYIADADLWFCLALNIFVNV